jgi:hypothetical protein
MRRRSAAKHLCVCNHVGRCFAALSMTLTARARCHPARQRGIPCFARDRGIPLKRGMTRARSCHPERANGALRAGEVAMTPHLKIESNSLNAASKLLKIQDHVFVSLEGGAARRRTFARCNHAGRCFAALRMTLHRRSLALLGMNFEGNLANLPQQQSKAERPHAHDFGTRAVDTLRDGTGFADGVALPHRRRRVVARDASDDAHCREQQHE